MVREKQSHSVDHTFPATSKSSTVFRCLAIVVANDLALFAPVAVDILQPNPLRLIKFAVLSPSLPLSIALLHSTVVPAIDDVAGGVVVVAVDHVDSMCCAFA